MTDCVLLPTTLIWKHHKEQLRREDYSEGYTIIVADLTPFDIGDNYDLKAEGTLSIDLVFKSPLPATINVLVYAEYDNAIDIDCNRNVIKDWSN